MNMTTDERTRRALERARENDSNNRDATRRVTSPAISGGSETTRSRTERALQSAKKKDRETKLITPSREQSGSAGGQVSSPMISGTRSSVGQMLESTMNRFSDRGLVDTYTNPDKWDTSSEAEAGMRQWSGELSDMEQRLTTQADSLSGMQTELSTLENNLNTQANVDRYNSLVEQYNSALETYSRDSDEYNRLRDRYSRGLTRYRDILSSGMERANEYAAEAELLSTRNSAIEDELRRYELGLPYFDGLASGISTGERMSRLQREYDSNQARIDQLLSDADKSRMEYYSSLRMAEDWEQNSAAIGSQRLAQLNAGETPYYGGGVVYDYINDIGGARDSLRGYDSTGTQYAAYGTMTPDEIGIYNYLYATQGADAAEEFLSEIRETLNYRLGTQNYENMSGFGKALYWIPAGLSQFTSGIEQLFSREAVPTSPTLYTSSLIQQEAQAKSPVLGTLYELGTTLSNMAPSVLASALGGWALGGTGMAAGTAARVAGLGGSAMLGASAGGNAYTQALNEGRSTDEARTYATLIGASEGTLQYLLGGIGSLGGIGVRSIASKIGALDNVLGRIASSTAGKLVGNMISEGTEEGLQELLEPAFRTLVFDEEYNADFGDVAYSFLLGALSAGIIDAPGAVREGIQQRRQPSAPDFSIMEGYIGEDGADNFQGVRTLEELDARYMEMAESENAEALDWENIVNQYKMARTFLAGMNAQENSQVQGASSEAAASPSETGGVVLPTSEELDARERLASATDDLERSGISAGVSEENIAAAQRISSALGRQVRFYDGAAEAGPAQVANGYYLDGTIYVNSRSTNPVAQIIAHELTHSVEMADAYSELSSLVLDHIQQSGVDLQQLRQSKRELYERNGVQLSSDADIDSEIVAEYIEKNLLTDEESIRTLTRNNRSLGARILAWLNELLARLGNAGARERAFVAEARDAYSRALAETAPAEQSQTAGQTAPATESRAEQTPEPETDTEANTEEPPSRASLRQLREDYAAGRLTDEEFDSALDAIEEQETLEGRSAFDDLRYSFGGRNAARANMASLEQAQQMEEQQVDAETIRQLTGWFRGADDKWRFEIDDSGMRFEPRGDLNFGDPDYQRYRELRNRLEAEMLDLGGTPLTEAEHAEFSELATRYSDYYRRPGVRGDGSLPSTRLSDYVQHDELFEQYPQLRDATLRFAELDGGELGSYNRETNTVTLDTSLRGEARSDTLVHEIQHAIQAQEGFAGGSSPAYWARLDYEASERLQREYRALFDSLSRDEQNKYTRYRELDRELNRLLFSNPGTEEAAQYARYEAEQDELYAELYSNVWFRELIDLERRIENPGDEYLNMYRNTAGEIEARDAAARRRLTAEERRATPPDTGDENMVFVEENLPAGYSIDENYERDIDDWDSRGRPDGEVFILGETGDVLQGLGAREQDIYLRSEKVNNIMEKHPEMTLSEIKRIPEVLDDPILVLSSSNAGRRSRNSRLVIFSEARAQNGQPIMAVLDLQPVENRIIINDMQKVNSAYTRNNAENYIRKSKVLYADEDKTMPLLSSIENSQSASSSSRLAHTGSGGLLRSGYVGSISYENGGVNIEGVPFEEVVSTEDTPQYSISRQRDRGEMLDQLRRYVNGEIDTSEIRAYIDGADDAQTEESSAAQSIIDQAHSEGMSVDEYLRQNWDEYEYDGELNETARRALELEREQARRRYSVSDPERVIIAPGGETIIENPTESEYRAMSNEAYQDFPWLWNTGETVVNVRQEPDGTRYIWSKSDGDAFPLNAQYSVDDGTALPTAAQSEYDEVYNSMPAKVRASMRRAENALLTGLGKVLSVPNAERHGELRDVVHDLELEYLNSGTVSQEVRDELFTRAYDAGVVIDREFYDQYKDVRDYLRTTNIDVGSEVQADIPDFNDFRDSMLGRMKIRTRYGTNIDQVYQDLNERWPELFPDNIIVPSDQLLKMAEAAQNIEVVQRSLDEYAGRDAKMFREAMRREFDAMVAKLIDKLRDVQRYMYDQENPDAVNAGIPVPQSAEEAAELWKQVKPLRRAYERTMSRYLLTRSDEQKVNDLMRGQMRLENLDPETDNVAGITAVYQAKQAHEAVIKPLRVWNQQRKAQLRERADQLLENANDWKDKRAGIMYSRETMERNIRDIVTDPKDAEAIISEYFTPVHEATANANRMKNSYRDRVRALDLSRRVADGNVVSEAHAVQLLGEAEDNIRMMEQSRGRIKARDGKSLSDWRAIVQNLWKENPNLDEQKIRGAVDEFRAIYDELFQQMNDVRVRNGYEPINYRSGYFPHFQPGEGDGILSQFGRVLGIDTQVTALPTTINGLTHTFRPGITWFGNAQERIGFNTVYDAVEGFDKYIEGVSDVITQTDNIQRLRALASQIRYRTTDDGIRAQIDTVRADPNKTEEDKQNKINEIYQEARFTLSNFVVQLDEYTNLLANKKSSLDRTVEGLVGRNRLYNFMKWFEGRVAANMVAINPASWLTNFVPLTQGWAGIGTRDLAVGLWDTLKAIKNDDGIIAKSTFLTNRMGSDPIVHAWEKDPEPESAVGKAFWNIGMKAGQWGDRLSYPMQFIDQIVSGALVRGRYYQNLGKGLSNDAAMADADAFAANVMADRSKGAVPTLFQSHNPFVKLLTQFQLEVNNQLGFIFKDIPREYRKYGIRALSTAIFKFVIGAWLFDELYEWLIGRRPALDPIGIAVDTFEDLSGWEIPNLVELGRGERPYRVEEQQGLFQTSTNLITNLAENLPFSSVFTDGGRLPISSAIPDLGALAEAILDDDKSPERRKQEIAKELGRLGTYALLPFGGGQLNRIYDTIRAVSEGGVYTYNDEGERLLQYPVYTDTAEQAIKNTLGAGIFGTTSLPTGREWIEDGFPTLTAEQTAVYQGMLDAGVSGEDAYDLIQEIRDIDSAEGKRYAIQQADISGDGKSVAYYGLFANNKEKALMDEMAGAGADMGEVTNTLIGIKQAASLKGAEETDFKLRAIIAADLTDDEKMQIYRGVISDKQDEDILSFLDAGLSFDQYLQAKREYAIIDENTENSDERAVEFANWVNEQGFTRDQAEVVQELAPMSGNLGKLADAGMDIESASDVANALDNLGEDATSTEEYMTIAQMPISESEKELALEAIMSESAFEKYERANSAGIDTYDYCLFLDTISGYSGDGRQEQVWAYIDSMPLTSAQKDALHLAAGYKESTLSKTPWH